jgi:tetratricopeptide (TPR) repeat protein
MASRWKTVAPLMTLTLFAGAAVAQQQPPECRNLSYRTNFRLNGAEQHIAQAGRSAFAEDRTRQLADAERLLGQAAAAGGVDQATLWYLFGQFYIMKHDLVGADSSFRKVEALTDPECKQEIARRRRNEWVPLQNAGVQQLNAGNTDSALALFRRSNVIYRAEPYAFLNMATIFVGKNQDDSAIYYYRAAANSTDDPRFAEARATALFNAARLVHRAANDTASIAAEARRRGVADSAVKNARLRTALEAYQDVLKVRPRDLQAQASLAAVLFDLQRAREGQEVYDSMLAHADSMESLDLFDAGVVLFRQERYGLAARAMELGLAKNRCYRDALFNLANTYLAARDSVHLLDAARRLVAVDSMNRQSLQLLAAAMQRNGDTQGTLQLLMRRDSLPWELTVLRFDMGDTTATIHAVVNNLQQKAMSGFKLKVQFVSGTCEPVAEQVVEIPDLNPNGSPGASYDFTVSGTGRGILAYKYGLQ